MSLVPVKDDVDTEEFTAVAANSKQRLVLSRLKLVKHMLGDADSRSNESIFNGKNHDINNTDSKQLLVQSGTWQAIKLSLSSWWRHHPANIVLAITTPLLHRYANRKPFQLLMISAGVGVIVALSKPWRLVSVGSLALAALKSSEFSSFVASMLTSEEEASQSADSARSHSQTFK